MAASASRSAAQRLFQLVGQYQLFFTHFMEFKDHLFQRPVQQAGEVNALFQIRF
ncbi:hypothetical protein ACVV4C_05780 [Escherichia coli]